MAQNRSTTKRRWLFRAAALLLSGLIAVAACEIALRIAGVSYGDLYRPDPYCGARLRAGYEGWFTREGRAYIRINAQGHRDVPHSLAKPPDTFRIAVLGDSFAEALQVPLEATFWHVMQKKLQSCPDLPFNQVEVLNFGVSGYGTAQQLQMLEHYGWQYEPDLVLVAFYPGNDVSNNSKTLEPDKARPFFRLENGHLVLDRSFLQDPAYLRDVQYYNSLRPRLMRASRLLQLLRELKRRRPQPPHTAQMATANEPGIADEAYRAPTSPVWREAWEITDRLLERIAESCRQKNVPLVVAVVTRGIQVHPDAAQTQQFRRQLQLPEGEDIWYPDARIIALGHRSGFSVVSLVEPLRAYAIEHGTFVHGFANAVPGGGHWNQEGHRLAGEVLAERICGLLKAQ